MNTHRVQDTVARIAGVSLQDTVSVLNAIYLVSKELEREGLEGYHSLRILLEEKLTESAVGWNGRIKGLREVPGRYDVMECNRLYEKIAAHFMEDLTKVRSNSAVELFHSIAQKKLGAPTFMEEQS